MLVDIDAEKEERNANEKLRYYINFYKIEEIFGKFL